MTRYQKSVLRQIPLFAKLTEAQLQFIVDRSSIVEYKKDQIIYRQEDPPNALFCLLSGRVVLSAKDKFGNDAVLEYLHRGKYFGIISLITGEPHSVTAKAINDSILLKIDREEFKKIISKIPQLSLDLMQSLSRRLKRKDLHPKTIFESTIICVYSSYAQAGKTVYAINLALSLKKETHKNIALVDISYKGKFHRIPQRLGAKAQFEELDLSYERDVEEYLKDYILRDIYGMDIMCLSYDPKDADNIKNMVAVLSLLVNDYHYIILDLPAWMDETIFVILNQSDIIHIISSALSVDLKKTYRLIERLKAEYNFQPEKIKIIINEYKQAKLTHEQMVGILGKDIYATLPKFENRAAELMVLNEPAIEYARAVRRISREVGDCLIGLALGVGAAYGLAHIGVLKVMEKERIPVDIVSGSSIGALIAAFWAAGFTAAEIEKIVLEEFKDTKIVRHLMDLTFPRVGFIKGYRIYRMLKKYLGKKTFYDIKMPLKVIACDVKQKRSVVIEKGYLVDAVLASCAMPGVFKPVQLKEELLVDGGILNPLPTEVLVRNNVRKIIAVNVTPSREDILKAFELAKQTGYQTEEKLIKKKGFLGLRWYFKDIFKIDILDFIFGSIEIMQSEMAQEEARVADIILHPDSSGLHWLEFYRAKEFIQRGEEETLRNLDKIKQLLQE